MFTVIVLGEHQSIVLPTPQRSPRAPSTTSSKTLSGDEPHQTQAPADQDGQEASNQEAANVSTDTSHGQYFLMYTSENPSLDPRPGG